jgi:hypothetical protein
MAASMYIVVEGDDPGFDIYVNGRALARNEDAIEKLALRIGVRPLLEFFSADENSLPLLIEAGASSSKVLDKMQSPQWYAAEDGLKTVNALIGALSDAPHSLGTEGPVVLSELLEYRQVLEKTAERNLRWHLAVSWK